MIMLMKFSTGEDWNQFMFELALQDQYNGVKCLVSDISFFILTDSYVYYKLCRNLKVTQTSLLTTE